MNTFEAWCETQDWYIACKPDEADDPHSDDRSIFRLLNIAAHQAWAAARTQALEEAADACVAELIEDDFVESDDHDYAVHQCINAIVRLKKETQ